MNEALSGGCDVVTGYRNSKNFGDNWISAGYSLWFLRESRLLNHARDILGTSAAVSGTGFAFTRELIERRGGWDCFLLTEDIQFTAESVLAGERIGYAPDAVLYDEQPTDLVQSFRQRRRWVRGSLQVFAKYGKRLLRGCPRDFACYDMIVNMLSGAVAGFAGMFMGAGAAVVRLCERDIIGAVVALMLPAVSGYIGLAALGAVTTMAEWKRIRCAAKENHVCIHLPALHGDLPACMRLGAVYRRRMGAGRAQSLRQRQRYLRRGRGVSCHAAGRFTASGLFLLKKFTSRA